MKLIPDLACSFCGLSEHDVPHLVAGPVALICSICVDIAMVAFNDMRRSDPFSGGEIEYRSWGLT